MRVRRGDGFPRRIGNLGRLKRLIYLLLDEGHQVGSEGGPIPLLPFLPF